MKSSVITATGLLVVAGAASVGALVKDQTGTGLGGQFGLPGIASGQFTISGSDTLKPVIQQILTANAASFSQGFNFIGGGQSVSDGALGSNTQQVSFGTASLKNSAYVGIKIDSEATGTTNGLAVQGTTEALVLGLDGLSILGNTTASGIPLDPSGNPTLAVLGKSFQVFAHNADGTENPGAQPVFPAGPNGHVTGATDTNYGAVQQGDLTWRYTIQSSLDVIRLVYAGLHHNGPSGIGDFNANSDVRRSLVDHWDAIFGGATSTSTTKLNHAYRRSDLAGTTNAFIALVGFGARGIGNLTGNAAANKKTSPFANDPGAASLTPGNLSGAITLTANGLPVDYNIAVAPNALRTNINAGRQDINSTVTTNGGPGDQLDLDPIRRPAKTSGLNGVDIVSGYGATLGLVLPIFYPDTPNITQAQAYPTILADPGAFAAVPAGPNGFDTSPNGDTLNSTSLQPYWLADGSNATGGTVATRHFELDTAGGGIHFHYVAVAHAKGTRDVVDPSSGAHLGDIDVAVVNDGTVNVALAVPVAKQYAKHFNAISKLNNTPGTAYSTDDGRAYNGPVRKDDILPTETTPYVLDANGRELANGFYKIRSLALPSPASNAAFLPYKANQQQTNSDFQTGAILSDDAQSIGFTGRGVDTNALSAAFNGSIAALYVSGPALPGTAIPPKDQNVLNLLVNPNGAVIGAATDPLGTTVKAAVYPLARRTYLATLVGFTESPAWSVAHGGSGTFNPTATATTDGGAAVRGLQGDEAILAQLFGQSDNVAAAFLNNGFVPLPHASQYIGSATAPAGNGGVFAVDYPESNSTAPTASYLATATGATPGGANRDATVASPPVLVPYSSP